MENTAPEEVDLVTANQESISHKSVDDSTPPTPPLAEEGTETKVAEPVQAEGAVLEPDRQSDESKAGLAVEATLPVDRQQEMKDVTPPIPGRTEEATAVVATPTLSQARQDSTNTWKATEDPERGKVKAVEELKAALLRAAAKPTGRRPETEALLVFCLCVRGLAKNGSQVSQELLECLPKLGEIWLAPFMGTRKAPSSNDAKTAPTQGSQRMNGRVKSYNTKKGFGFIDMPGFNRDIFVYNAHLVGRIGLLAGESVSFDLTFDGERPQARNVKVLPGTNKVVPFNTENPLHVMKQAMAMAQPAGAPAPPSMRDLALAMAAAAAEIPTTLPTQHRGGGQRFAMHEKSQEEQLYDKIREAQTVAASDKRRPTKPKEDHRIAPAETQNRFTDWRTNQPIGSLAALGVARGGDNQTADAESKFMDEGNIPQGSTVRVINFPAIEVNDSLGIVQGYEAATGRYSVTVELKKGTGTGTSEKVPLQLKEEYLRVEHIPPEARPNPMAAVASVAAAQAASQFSPPPLPGSPSQSHALRKSASDALRRFGHLSNPQPTPTPGQWPGMSPNPGFAAAANERTYGRGPYAQNLGAAGAVSGHQDPREMTGYPPTTGVSQSPYGGTAGVPPTRNGRSEQVLQSPAQTAPMPTGRPAMTAPSGTGMQTMPGGSYSQSMPRGQMQSQARPLGAALGPMATPESGAKRDDSQLAGGTNRVGTIGAPSSGVNAASKQFLSLEHSVPGLDRPDGQQSPAPADQRQSSSGQLAAGQWSTGSGGPGAAGQSRTSAAGATQPTGTPLEHWAKVPTLPGPTMTPSAGGAARPPAGMLGANTTPATSQPGAAQQRSHHNAPPEGRLGQHWRVLASKDFCDVIVRETQEVTSKELRRIMPNEVCVQRGQTVALQNGLVRMPVQPEGWVTVHARLIGGPTFMDESDGRQQRVATSSQERASASQPTPSAASTRAATNTAPASTAAPVGSAAKTGAGVSGGSKPGQAAAAATQSRGGTWTSPGRERPSPSQVDGSASSPKQLSRAEVPTATRSRVESKSGPQPWKEGEDPWSKTVDPWAHPGAATATSQQRQAQKSASDSALPWGPVGPSYDKTILLTARQQLLKTPLDTSLGTAGIRMLHVPSTEVGSSREQRKRDRRERAQEEENDDRSYVPSGNHRDKTPVRGAVTENRHGVTTSKEANVTEVTKPIESTTAAGTTATATASANGNTASNTNTADSAGAAFIVNAVAAANPSEEKPVEKTTEEKKANCPTQ